MSLQFKFSVLNQALLRHSLCKNINLDLLLPLSEECMLLAFPPHPFAYFPLSGYLSRTPDDSNFFRFPQKVLIIGS